MSSSDGESLDGSSLFFFFSVAEDSSGLLFLRVDLSMRVDLSIWAGVQSVPGTLSYMAFTRSKVTFSASFVLPNEKTFARW